MSSDLEHKLNNKNFEIDISLDNMEAYITFKKNDEDTITDVLNFYEVKEAIKNKGIKYGIDEEKLNIIVQDYKYNKRYCIAKGKKPKKGEDGYLDLKFDISDKTLKPKELSDGSVDYRNLNLISTINKGDILASIVHPSKGEDGFNVFGELIEGLYGKLAPKLPKGKNTVISEDGINLISEVDGQIIYLENKISVSEVLEIAGDVGVGTGNINFNGSIIVKGNIMTDFSVKALGNVEVYGVVEGAEIYSGGNIIVNKGIIGMCKSNIHAEGSITSKSIQDSNIVSKGNIYTDGIMHSNIKCEGIIELKGKKALLVGGKITVKNGLKANIIGSPMGTMTEICVGLDTDILENYNKILAELNKSKIEYKNYIKSLQTMLKFKDMANIPKGKKLSFLNTINLVKDLKNKIENLQRKAESNNPILYENLKNAYIKVEKVIYPGVIIRIGNAFRNIDDEFNTCTIINIDGKIEILKK